MNENTNQREIKVVIQNSDYREHLEQATKTVGNWPEWKRNLIGYHSLSERQDQD